MRVAPKVRLTDEQRTRLQSAAKGRSVSVRAGLEAFGAVPMASSGMAVRVVREGGRVAVYTVGYEKRDGEELISVLQDQGIKALADVRERPVSRKADFRAAALRALCQSAGIEYLSWASLGSTLEQREELQASGDFRRFAQRFRSYALKNMKADLARLAKMVQRVPTALLCYERLHEDCHRSVIADLISEQIDASIIAIV